MYMYIYKCISSSKGKYNENHEDIHVGYTARAWWKEATFYVASDRRLFCISTTLNHCAPQQDL
jgi:hypothetical protein